jgi:hypothetical protein
MDIKDVIQNAVKVKRNEQLKNSPQFTLGELIMKLEGFAQDLQVVFDFDDMHPTSKTSLCSWRGSYDELAIEYTKQGLGPELHEFLKRLRQAIGETFLGWKGGEFVMGKRTPLWVDNCGDGGHRGVVGAKVKDRRVIIQTAECEY